MRKRSASVALGAVLSAAMLAACGSKPDPTHSEICIDEKSKQRVDDDDCRRGTSGRTFFYMPYSHAVPAVGGAVDTSQGSTVKPAGARVATVSRSGFGGRAGGSGS